MYFTINIDKDEFDMSQEEHQFHERIINQFKNEYTYAFTYIECKTPHINLTLNYSTENRKFQLLSISGLKHVHDYLMRSDGKIMDWFVV